MNLKNITKTVLLFSILALYFSLDKVNASGIFPEEHYCLPKNKSMLMCPSNKISNDFIWSSTNKNVIDIDNRGIITGNLQGKCTIQAKNKKSGQISKCNVLVTPEEHIKSIYSLPNQPIVGDKLNIYAITSKEVKNVKFSISGQGNSQEIIAKKIKSIGNRYLWTGQAILKKSGNYYIKTFAISNKSWNFYKNGETNITVSHQSKPNESSCSARNASEKCIKFISSCEGFSSNVIPDYKHTFSIGHGHILQPFTAFNKNISREEALSILIKDVNNSQYGRVLNNFLVKNKIYLNQQQFDALLSFTYNLGIGWIVNRSDIKSLILNINSENNILMGKVMSTDGLNLRKEPSTSARKIKSLKYGECVKILNTPKFNQSWYLIKTSDGKTGYCYGKYIKSYIESPGQGKNLNSLDKETFKKLFCAYHHAGGRCNTALLSRRFHELDIFFYGKYADFNHAYCKNSAYTLPTCIKRTIFK